MILFVEYKLILKTFIEFYIFLTITGLGLRKRCRYIYILVTRDSLQFFHLQFLPLQPSSKPQVLPSLPELRT